MSHKEASRIGLLMALVARRVTGREVAAALAVPVMGPGGYRFTDYLKLGVPLTLVVLLAVALLLPIFWPLYPAR